MDDTQPPTSGHKRPWRFHDTVAAVAVTLLALIIGAVAIKYYNVTHLAQHDQKKITIARAKALKADDKSASDKVNTLRSLGLIGNQVASSKVDVCAIDDYRPAMFDSTKHRQGCFLRYVKGFETNKTEQQIQDVLAYSENSTFDQSHSYVECEITDTEVLKLSAVEATADKKYWKCQPPPQNGEEWQAPFDPSQEAITTFEPLETTSIDRTKTIVWLTVIDNYWHEDLGCKYPHAPFSCPAPRHTPITAG